MSYAKQILKQLHFWRISSLLLADAILFGATDPDKVVSSVLIIGFILLCITLYYVVDGMLALAKLYGLPVRRKKRLHRAITLVAGALIAFQSIGQLSIRDLLILSPFTLLFYFYVAYAKNGHRRLSVRTIDTQQI